MWHIHYKNNNLYNYEEKTFFPIEKKVKWLWLDIEQIKDIFCIWKSKVILKEIVKWQKEEIFKMINKVANIFNIDASDYMIDKLNLILLDVVPYKKSNKEFIIKIWVSKSINKEQGFSSCNAYFLFNKEDNILQFLEYKLFQHENLEFWYMSQHSYMHYIDWDLVLNKKTKSTKYLMQRQYQFKFLNNKQDKNKIVNEKNNTLYYENAFLQIIFPESITYSITIWNKKWKEIYEKIVKEQNKISNVCFISKLKSNWEIDIEIWNINKTKKHYEKPNIKPLSYYLTWFNACKGIRFHYFFKNQQKILIPYPYIFVFEENKKIYYGIMTANWKYWIFVKS